MGRWFCLCLAVLLAANAAGATVGGPQEIKALGWDQARGKAYFMVKYHDESGRLPDLMVYSLADRSLVTEKALPQESFADPKKYPAYEAAFKKYLSGIQSDLRSLVVSEFPGLKISYAVLVSGSYFPPESDNKSYKINYWKDRVKISEQGEELSFIDLDVYYENDFTVVDRYGTPGSSLRAVILRCKGLPYELGYDKDSIVFIPQEKLTSIRYIDPKEITGH